MGIFDWLFGKQTLSQKEIERIRNRIKKETPSKPKEAVKKPKKETTSKLTDDQKHWLGLVEMRVNSLPFDFIKRTYTVDSLGDAHFDEYKANEPQVPEDKREEVALARVEGLSSIRDYIQSNGSEEQKFHLASSIKGALLYASSLGINVDKYETTPKPKKEVKNPKKKTTSVSKNHHNIKSYKCKVDGSVIEGDSLKNFLDMASYLQGLIKASSIASSSKPKKVRYNNGKVLWEWEEIKSFVEFMDKKDPNSFVLHLEYLAFCEWEFGKIPINILMELAKFWKGDISQDKLDSRFSSALIAEAIKEDNP